MTHTQKYEKHTGKIGGAIKDIVYGANDGIITTFAVVAGVTGAALETKTIIILGIANLVADGFSMAASNFLGSRSERELIESERERELREIDNIPEEEKEEVRQILDKQGYAKEDASALSTLISKNKAFFADFMLRYELGLNSKQNGDAFSATMTFLAFTFAGLLPLLPFIFYSGENSFLISAASTAVSLFIVGSLRMLVTGKNWIISGLEMLFVGGIAAGVAYGIGFGISQII